MEEKKLSDRVKVEVVTISLDDLIRIIEDVVDKTMEKWYDKERRNAREEQLEKEAYLTMQELMDLTGYCRSSLISKIKDGTINAYKKPNSNRLIFRKQEIIEKINNGILRKSFSKADREKIGWGKEDSV
ncbi:MAG: hypothetical protein J5510_06435 [Prevotella sp.]|nr:hypothetical protein [Prevotella sp.]